MASQHSATRRNRTRRTTKARLHAAIAFGIAALAITGGGVFATLTATTFNPTPQTVTSGTLSLSMANSGAGFSQGISNLAPGDTVNRFVTLTQGAILEAQALTVAVGDTTTSKLTSDPASGLHLTVNQCTVAWTYASGVCSGTTTTLLTSTSLSSLISSASSLVSGSIAKSSILYLQMQLVLPDKTENTANGTLPAGTIQGLSASLTWTFGETQRTSTSTNS